MKSYKLIAALLLIPTLVLAGFSAAVLTLPQPQQSAPVAAAAPVTAPVQQVAAPVSPSANAALSAFQDTFEQIYANVDPSVVNIQVIQSGSASSSFQQVQPGNPFGSPPSQGGGEVLGSGFVWDSQGHIVTNNHVIAGAQSITVTFSDGTTVSAKVVGTDPNSDLAVLQVNAPASELHPVQMGNSNQVKVGQIAIAIGNPYGLSGTMTEGIISGLSRSLPVGLNNLQQQTGPTYAIPDIIQTDAAINPGNSGGVLLDVQGQVIGVTAAIQSPVDANSGIGFVIPSSIVEKVVPQLIQTGHYNHPWIGISGTSLTYDLAKAMNLNPDQKGALVVSVAPNSPAQKAGLQGGSNQTTVSGQPVLLGGDVIVAINGQSVNSFEDLSSYLINNTQAGQTVTLTILRQGQQQTVQLTLGVLPAQPGQ
jgi:serine protease Do